MYLTPKRIKTQVAKLDKVLRVIWRLYSPYRQHRKLIVKAAYLLMEAEETLEQLSEVTKKDFKQEMNQPLTQKSIPPGGYTKEDA